jgi:ATP-dependent Zn protease
MNYINILYYSYLIFIVFNNIDRNSFKFIDYNDWNNIAYGKQLYVFDNRNYCIKSNSNLIYNYYTCCQNIEFVKNKYTLSSSNIINTSNTTNTINDLSDEEINKLNSIKEIIYINTKNKNSIYQIIGYIVIIIYIVIWVLFKFYGFIMRLISIIANSILKMFGIDLNKNINATNLQNTTNTNNTNNNLLPNSSSSTSISLGSMFENILGDETLIEVKTSKDPSSTIDNFIGCANIKKEISKIINQIKYESIYRDMNCELPKGVLLIGPPGVGKTHLVKTIINSTGMKHIFISGSDFNKKYVGSGSSTVAKLFKKARENKPCLIFIDEADTILKKRSHNETSAASVDSNSTICKFLAEMDSLKTESGVIVIFASNMDIDYIDKGIIRAGRVDQIIHISHPTFEERIELFKMYLKNLYDNKLIDINKISKLSYGLTGSDVKKIINLIKINKVEEYIKNNPNDIDSEINFTTGNCDYFINFNKDIEDKEDIENNENSNDSEDIEDSEDSEDINKCNNNGMDDDKNEYINIPIKITTDDIDKEISKCIMGLERDRKVNEMNKKIIAYHEAGHAILGFLISGSIIPEKICISINSKSLGYTLFPQEDDDLLVRTTISQLLIEVMILYGGRMSEKIFIGDITCGAEDDYSRARKILKRLIMNGMLVPENNYVDFGDKETKMTEQMEKQLKSINKIIQQDIKFLFSEYSQIVHQTAEKIIEYGSIISDDIYEIFDKNGLRDKVGSYNIEALKYTIKKFLS